MTDVEKFLARGAHSVAGSIILNNKTMGDVRNGVLILTSEGLAELEIDEVIPRMASEAPESTEIDEVVKPVKVAKKPKVAKVVEPVVEAPAESELDPLDFGDLLSDVE